MNAPSKPPAELDHPEVFLPEPGLAVSLARAEIDQQIATARAFPRSIDRAMKNILTLATLDEETAQECIFALPRGGKPIVGPSIRLAEIIVSQWGNNRASARVVHVDRVEKFVEAEGVFHDLETNTATCARVRRRVSDSKGRLYSDDMIIVTGNAACSIAKRNAILGGVPKGVWRRAYDHAERVIAVTAETLVVTRDKTMKAFAAFGVTPERVCASIGVGGLDDIALTHIPTLRGMYAALKNGEATVEEMFADSKAVLKPVGPVDIPEPAAEPAKEAATSPAPTAETLAQTAPSTEKEPENKAAAEPTRGGRGKQKNNVDVVRPPTSGPEKIDPAAFLRSLEDQIAACDDQDALDAVTMKNADAIEALHEPFQQQARDLLAAASG